MIVKLVIFLDLSFCLTFQPPSVYYYKPPPLIHMRNSLCSRSLNPSHPQIPLRSRQWLTSSSHSSFPVSSLPICFYFLLYLSAAFLALCLYLSAIIWLILFDLKGL